MDLITMLHGLMSTDNISRNTNEQSFHAILQSNPTQMIQELLHVFTNASIDLMLRSFAGILLRRSIELYAQSLSNEGGEDAFTTSYRQQLMNMWTFETNPILLRRLSHIIAQSASITSWEQLLPDIINYAAAMQGVSLVLILNLIEIISEYCPEAVTDNLQNLGSFLATFLQSDIPALQVACAKATVACIISIEDEGLRSSFKPALLPIINILGETLNRNDELDATNMMEHLVTIAEMQPIFFKGSLDAVVSAMLSVASSNTLEFSTRCMALELMVTITETAPALARRCNSLMQGLIPLSMSLMLEYEESEQDWMSGKYTDEMPDDSYSIGDGAIQRITAGIGGGSIATAILSNVQNFAQDRLDWTRRRAAVAGLARFADGSPKQFKKYFEESLKFITNSLQDPIARVRFEGIQTIGRFAAIYPEETKQLVDNFLPQLAVFMQDQSQCDRIRGHAASALINLLTPEHCEAEMLESYLQPLLNSLVICLETASFEIKSPCLTLLGCIAQVTNEGFVDYYSSFMPGIKTILITATSPEMTEVRGKAMECVGLIGEAVGVEIFSNDALEIMQLFMNAMHQDIEKDCTFEYILPACARISKALGADFSPFLQMVMEPLLRGATQEIKFSMVDADIDDLEGEVIRDDEEGTESAVVSLGGGVKKRVTLNTHAVQEKNQAARILFEFASSLKGYLQSYIIPSLEAIIPMLTDKHSSDIRSSASLALDKIFEAYIHSIKIGITSQSVEEINKILSVCLSKIIECLTGEINQTSRICAAEALRNILITCYNAGDEDVDGSRRNFVIKPDTNQSEQLVTKLLSFCNDSLIRRNQVLSSTQNNEGYDAEDQEGIVEVDEEDELMTHLADSLGQLLKLNGESFMGLFDQLIVPAFSPYLQSSQPQSLQAIAVCLIDDAIEFGGNSSQKYIPTLIPVLLNNFNSDHLILKQSSVYGVAKACSVAPTIIASMLDQVLPAFINVLNDPQASDEDNEGTTENATFAIGIICSNPIFRAVIQSSNNNINLNELAGEWMKKLPLRADEQEAKAAHLALCDMVEKNDLFITDNNLSDILRIFAEILSTASANESTSGQSIDDEKMNLAHPVTLQRMQSILKQLAANSSANPMKKDQLQNAFNCLSSDNQTLIQGIF
eukprot:gene10303-13849_t